MVTQNQNQSLENQKKDSQMQKKSNKQLKFNILCDNCANYGMLVIGDTMES